MTGYDEQFYAWRDSSTRASADAVAGMAFELFDPRSVVDLGCGVGTWLSVFADKGVDDVFGVEGHWAAKAPLKVDASLVRFHDLTTPIEIDRTFDLALCLEVAEHLPASSAASLVATLTDLADVVFFSAAIPHQGGVGHVNEQWPEYWAELFSARGFAATDPLRPRLRRMPRIKFWYAQNLLVYVREARLSEFPELAACQVPADDLSRVHPELYLRNSDLARQSLRRLVAAVPKAFSLAVSRRLRRGSRRASADG